MPVCSRGRGPHQHPAVLPAPRSEGDLTATPPAEQHREAYRSARALSGESRGRRIECPTLVLWSSRDDLAELYGDVLAVWRPWTTALSGGPIESGHHVAEDAPDVLASRLAGFFAG